MFRIRSFLVTNRLQNRLNIKDDEFISTHQQSETKEQKKNRSFLCAVLNNEVEAVSYLLTLKPPPDINTTDDNDRSALMIATDMGHIGMLKLLLNHGAKLGDVLFRAIHVHSIAAVQEICEYCNTYVQTDMLNAYPEGNDFPSWTTPIILACRLNLFHIVKILLLHGATMPILEDTQKMADNRLHERAISCLQWHQAVSSDAYILLTSDDPVQSSFDLLNKFKIFSKKDVYNEDEYEILAKKIENFTIKLLENTKNSDEINIFLNAGEEDREASSTERAVRQLPTRLRDAVRFNCKKFIAHSNFQSYMLERFYDGCIRWNEYPNWKFLGMTLIVGLFYPFWCVCYLVTTNFHFTKSAYVRYIFRFVSRLTLLCLLLYSTESIQKSEKFNPEDAGSGEDLKTLYVGYRSGMNAQGFTLATMLIYTWLAGITWREIKHIYWNGIKGYFKNIFNAVDFAQLMLYWISLISGIVARTRAQELTASTGWIEQYGTTSNHTGNESRADWNTFDPSLISEAAYSLANVLTFFALLHMMVLLAFVGPLQISLGGMIKDILKFFMLFSLVWISFSLGLTQLYRTSNKLKLTNCHSNCDDVAFESFAGSLMTLFWSLFDLPETEILVLNDNLWFTESVGMGLYIGYLIIAVVIMLNALIAMMSNTYTRVEENSVLEWKVARTKLMMEFMAESATMPPPFNILPSLKSILRLVQRIKHTSVRCKKNSNQVSTMRVKPRSQETYQMLIQEIVARYIRKMQTDLARERQGCMLQFEVMRLKESNEGIRTELHNLQQRNATMLTGLKNQMQQLSDYIKEQNHSSVTEEESTTHLTDD